MPLQSHGVVLWPSVNLNWKLQSWNARVGSKLAIFTLVTLKFVMTSRNNRTHLLCYFKLCASFRSHLWIIQTELQSGNVQIGVKFVLTPLTLTFDLVLLHERWTSPMSMVITSKHFMMIRWEEHYEKRCDKWMDGRTDGRIDGQDRSQSCLVAAKNRNSGYTCTSATGRPCFPRGGCRIWTTSAASMCKDDTKCAYIVS